MSNNDIHLSTFAIEKGKTRAVNFNNVYSNFKHYWYLFPASVIVMLLIAFIYLQFAPPVYEIKATLLINQDKSSDTQPQQSVLDKIDLPNNSNITENEIAKIKSIDLIKDVISDLQLGVIYKTKTNGVSHDLYSSLPFKFSFIKQNHGDDESEDAPHVLKITVEDQNTFSYLNPNGQSEQHSFNSPVTSDAGVWKLTPTELTNRYKNKTITVNLSDTDKLALSYQKSIDASLEDKLSSAVDLTITDNNKQRGKDILNRLIYVYNNADVEDKNKESQSTVDFINKKLDSLSSQLVGTEKNLENFKSSNQLTDISSDSKADLENLQSSDAQLNELNVKLSVIEGVEKYINSPQNQSKAPAIYGIDDQSLAGLVNKLSDLQLKRQALLATTPETNPDFEELNSEIQTTRSDVKAKVESIKSAILNAKGKVQSVNSKIESSITQMPSQQRQYIDIQRQQALKESLYTYLLQKRQEISLKYATTVKNYEVIDNAYSGPVKWPIKGAVYAIAFLFGLIVPMGIIYGKSTITNVIVDPSEIEEGLGRPIFSEISNYDSPSNVIIVSDKKTDLVNEQFRALRSKLHYLGDEDGQGKVILVTSSIAGEGKSFITGNLGVALAAANKKTIILELDLRRSKISDIFKLSDNDAGITDYLTGEKSVNEIIKKVDTASGVHVIPKGTAVSNPSELLENNKLSELLNTLKNTYDYILIDSPPIHLVTDALIISRYVQITLYIIKQGVTNKTEISFIKGLLADGKLPGMELILNGINNKRYGYGYQYNSSYYKPNTK